MYNEIHFGEPSPASRLFQTDLTPSQLRFIQRLLPNEYLLEPMGKSQKKDTLQPPGFFKKPSTAEIPVPTLTMKKAPSTKSEFSIRLEAPRPEPTNIISLEIPTQLKKAPSVDQPPQIIPQPKLQPQSQTKIHLQLPPQLPTEQPKPQPQPQIQIQVPSQIQPQPQPQPQVAFQAQPQVQPRPEPQPQIQARPQPQAIKPQIEIAPVTKPQVQLKSPEKPQPKPESKPEPKPEPKSTIITLPPPTQIQAQPQPKPQVQPEREREKEKQVPQPIAKPEQKSPVQAPEKPIIQAIAQPQAKPPVQEKEKEKPQPQPQPQPQVKPEPKPQVQPEKEKEKEKPAPQPIVKPEPKPKPQVVEEKPKPAPSTQIQLKKPPGMEKKVTVNETPTFATTTTKIIYKPPAEGLKKCYEVLQKLKKHMYATPFLQPVNEKALGITDYYQIIKHPMDLGTVEKKLKNEEYANQTMFGADVRQIWRNAMIYNAEGSPIYNVTLEMSAFFERLFKDIELNYPPPPPEKEPYDIDKKVRKLCKQMQGLHHKGGKFTAVDSQSSKYSSIRDVPMTPIERKALYINVHKLPSAYMRGVWDIVNDNVPPEKKNREVVEFDLETLPVDIMRKLERFVDYQIGIVSKSEQKSRKKESEMEVESAEKEGRDEDESSESSFASESEDGGDDF